MALYRAEAFGPVSKAAPEKQIRKIRTVRIESLLLSSYGQAV
jgi:hypothetical protein